MHVQIAPQPLDISLQNGRSGRWRGAAPPRVLLAGRLTALAEPDGDEVAMQALARALPAAGVAARLWRPWEDSLADVDGLHLFGSLPEHLPVIEAARRQKIPVVLSPMAWHELADCLRQRQPVTRGLAACARLLGRALVPHWPSWRRRLYRSVDLLLPNSDAEARQLMHYFRIPAERMHLVPSGAAPQVAAADPELFVRRVGVRRFVLYLGQIGPRNNQLSFLWAMRDADVPVVVLGDAAPGCEWYLAECRRSAAPGVQFVQHVQHGDPLLASAYAACGCLVLASWFDPPGCPALEAAMSGTPLVLPEGGCAGEYFGRQAFYVNPCDMPGIRSAVLAALARGRSKSLARHVHTYFSWDAAAKATREAYQRVLHRGGRAVAASS